FSSSYSKTLFHIGEYPWVLAVGNRFGLVGRYGNTTEVPVFERFFVGGADTIRGYTADSQIGPKEGGRFMYIFNTELRFPIAREKKRTLVQGAFFFDMGNSWYDLDDVELKVGPERRQLKMGAGFGIRFTMPGFPIRLDWGYGFNHASGESPTEFYFSMGSPF
ncbi:MAG: BamA/TamA family outer membrane protein, partial [Elusimicrobia bacterium]|nr:BamA/TamA family outer membrane protein [Elusimicrobiota bacterium]